MSEYMTEPLQIIIIHSSDSTDSNTQYITPTNDTLNCCVTSKVFVVALPGL